MKEISREHDGHLCKAELDHSEGWPHVLMVSNHWGAKKTIIPYAGVFVGSQLESLQKAGVKISTFDIGTSHSPIKLLWKWVGLRRQVKRLKPDLIHSQFGTIVAILGAFAGRAFVVSFTGPDLLGGAPVSRFRIGIGHGLSNIAALRASGIICKSEGLRQALWWRQKTAVVIPNGVDFNLFSPGSRKEARKNLGWDLIRPIIITYVRNIPKSKGLDIAEGALKVAQKHLPTACLKTIGNSHHDRMPLYYRAADVLVCASRFPEGSPNVIKEALACNLPVVSVPVGDVVERLAGVQPSAVVSRDPEVIGDALIEILRERKRSNGREQVSHLALELVAERLLTLYRAVLAKR